MLIAALEQIWPAIISQTLYRISKQVHVGQLLLAPDIFQLPNGSHADPCTVLMYAIAQCIC
jgi:hypothetical protein